MLGANTTITIHRAFTGANGQSVYGAAHATVECYLEPAGDGLVLAQGAPIGSLYSLFTDRLVTPDTVQVSDLAKTPDGTCYLISGIQRYENHTVLSVSSYEHPVFTILVTPVATITSATPVAHGTAGLTATVADAGTGATYAWSMTRGTITAGGTTKAITYTAGTAGSNVITVTVTHVSGGSAVGTKTVTIT